MMTNEQSLEIRERCPNKPKTAEEHAALHDMIYCFDNTVLHLSGGNFVSIRYPNGEMYVFNTVGEGLQLTQES